MSERLMVVTVPTDVSAQLFPVGPTRLSCGAESIEMLPGEVAYVENGHIVAPRRILDQRLIGLITRLRKASRTA